MDSRPQSPVLIAIIVVLNIIWWMIMIAAIGLGVLHLNSCPVQPKIPIYLIVLGAVTLLSLVFTYGSNSQAVAGQLLSTACMTVLHIFSVSWLIAGSLWVYDIYPPNYYGKERYCHKVTYQFAFVISTLLWVALALVFISGSCCALLTCCTATAAGRPLIPIQKRFYGATSASPEPSAENA